MWQVRSAYKVPLAKICELFDSVYVSFYKDLGAACAGAMLLGDVRFVQNAVTWRRRFGGSLVSMFPMAPASAWAYVFVVWFVFICIIYIMFFFFLDIVNVVKHWDKAMALRTCAPYLKLCRPPKQ